jgi:hypothetical protein
MHYLSILTFILFFTSISFAQDLFNYSVEEFKADTENQMLSFSMLDDSLYAVSDLNRAHIEIINKNTGVTVRKIGKRGRGPGEIGRINFFTYDKVNQVFTVFDSGGFSIKRFNLNGEVIDEKLLPKDQVFMPYYGHQIDEDNLYVFAYNYTNENILHQYSISKNEYVNSYIKFNEITSNIDDEVVHRLLVGGTYSSNFCYSIDNKILLTTRLKDDYIYIVDKSTSSLDFINLPTILEKASITAINPSKTEGFQVISSFSNQYAYKAFEHVIGLSKIGNKLLCFVQLDKEEISPNNFGVHVYYIGDIAKLKYIGYQAISDMKVNHKRDYYAQTPQYFLHQTVDNRFYFYNYGKKSNSIVELTLDFRD